jgi:hypothetical protein
MGLKEAVQGFRDGLRKTPSINVLGGMTQAPANPVNVMTGLAGVGQSNVQNAIEVVNTLKLPTNANIPGSWTRGWLAPGKPFASDNFQTEEAEQEPRSFQYIASINATITPRLAYGLMPFSELKAYANNVPEVALCVRLPTEELKAFIPTLVDDSDKPLYIPELEWMTTRPDRFNPWPVWLSRFLYNVLVYDAPGVYKIRDMRGNDETVIKKGRYGYRKDTELVNHPEEDGSVTPYLRWYCKQCGKDNVFSSEQRIYECVNCQSRCTKRQAAEFDNEIRVVEKPKLEKGLQKLNSSPIVGLRIIDGSTLFSIIDERGEQPQPPAPSFTQVIWGVPRMYLNTYQLWYRPRFLRADAPYGKSFIEDSLVSVRLLAQLWDYELDKYVIGNIPEASYAAPSDWKSVDQILEYEDIYNARMSGNNKEQAGRLRIFPNGMELLATKEMTFNRETYDTASNAVRIAAGIPKSEVGEAPEGMLGGKGFAEAMNSAFYRMCISPLQTFVEGLFNDIIEENGYTGVKFKLKFPNESIDPEKEEAKTTGRFTAGLTTRDEARAAISMDPCEDPEQGKYMVTPGGTPGGDDGMGGLASMLGGNKKPGTMKKPVDVLEDPIDVLEEPVDVKKLIKVKKPDITEDYAIELGERIGVDWEKITIEEFMAGLQDEQEHFDTTKGDEITMANIALDHLQEDPQYYTKLSSVEKLAKHCGVCPEDDQYYGAPITHALDVEMPHQGANESNIVGIGGLGQEIRPAVWKPVTGEDPKLQEWVGGELYRRAEAVYAVDRELAPDENHYLVPVTWKDTLNGVEGSIQHYVRGREMRNEVATYEPAFVAQAAVLDYITGQVDRINKNWFTHPEDDKRPVLIDSDLSFPVKGDQKVRSTFVEAMRGMALPTDLLESVFLIIGNHDLWSDLRVCLNSEEAVQGALKRATDLYEQRMIPIVPPEE